jgi:rhodanese-related sulfurtransferase
VGLFTRTNGVDASSVAERLANRSVLVIDVRQPAEWRKGHIRGSLNLPLTQLGSRLHKLPNDKTVVVVCASGHRSAVAARTVQRAGYQVENLKGGMGAWARAGLPLEPTSRTAR